MQRLMIWITGISQLQELLRSRFPCRPEWLESFQISVFFRKTSTQRANYYREGWGVFSCIRLKTSCTGRTSNISWEVCCINANSPNITTTEWTSLTILNLKHMLRLSVSIVRIFLRSITGRQVDEVEALSTSFVRQNGYYSVSVQKLSFTRSGLRFCGFIMIEDSFDMFWRVQFPRRISP